MRALILILLLALPSPVLADVLELRRSAEMFAQGPVALDSRLQVPACAPGFAFSWVEGRHRLVEARCPASAWRLLIVPMARERLQVRRGQPVRVESRGAGFTVRVDAIAEGPGSGGMLEVRNSRSRQRFGAVADANGRLSLAAGAEALTRTD